MKKVNIYLAGGMSSFGKDNFGKCNEWRTDLSSQFHNITQGQVSCCNPNDFYNFVDEPPSYDNEREVMEYDLYRVRNSDVVIVNFNDTHSLGTMAELAISYEMKKPVIGLCEDKEILLHPWQKEMCNKIFSDREDLVYYVLKYYCY